jgi:lipoprotein-anchoring transpeptidase ErfK/SrfK
MRRFPATLRLPALALVVVGLLVAGCATADPDRPQLGAAAPAAPATATPAEPTPAPAPAPSADPSAATIARTDDALTVHAEPSVDAAVVTRLAATTEFGSPRALLVVDRADRWVEVQLPIRPNGSTGWIREAALDLVEGEHRVEVDLAARTLTVFAGDEVVLETPVAVGAPDSPTPTGTFGLTDRLQSPDPASPYGPFALGLSAHSDTFSEFAGGDGQIGIHGTDDPSSIGRPVSHGCVRVPNDVVARLAELLPLGTPVTIA